MRLLQAGEEAASLGSWEWLPGPDAQLWSDNLYRLFEREPREITPTREFVLAQTHPDDRERVARYIEMTRRLESPPPIEYRIVQPGREVRYLRSTITAIDHGPGAATRIVGVVQDITDERLVAREIAAHIAASRVLAEWEGLRTSGQLLLRGLAESFECSFAALWAPDDDVIAARLDWSAPSLPGSARVEQATRGIRLPRGIGLVGQVWQRKAPVIFGDLDSEPDYRRAQAAAEADLHAGLAFPALHGHEVLAVVELCSRERLNPTARLGQTLGAIGYELGEFFTRRRAELHTQPLSPRELQVLRMAAEGQSHVTIGDSLSVSATTVATHMKHIYRKFGVHDRTAAVVAGFRLGLLD